VNRPLIALACLIVAGGTAGGALIIASPGGEEEAGVEQLQTSTPLATALLTPGPGVTLWRWMSVTLLIPDGSGIGATPDVIYLDDQGTQSRPVIKVGKADPENPGTFSIVMIDAEDGTVYRREILDQHRTEMELVLATLAVSEFDPASAPWPYNGDPLANAQREVWFGISIIRPVPATGIIVESSIGSFVRSGVATPRECEVADQALSVWNGRSKAFVWVDASTGALCKDVSHVDPVDFAAFERFLSDAKRCGKDIEC